MYPEKRTVGGGHEDWRCYVRSANGRTDSPNGLQNRYEVTQRVVMGDPVKQEPDSSCFSLLLNIQTIIVIFS